MTTYNINKLYAGFKIILEGEPYIVIENEFVKPGKGQAFSRLRIRNLISNKFLIKILKSTDSVKIAHIIDQSLMYLYDDNKFCYFMDNNNFEQLIIDKKIINNNIKWLINQVNYNITLWNGYPIFITPPNFVELKVIKTNPSLKGNTIITKGKLATLNTGVIIKVPQFIQIGEIIKVDTRSSEYISRVK